MPSAILVLQRFFLRVDQVAFRVFDTRLFVPFRQGAFAHMVRSDAEANTDLSANDLSEGKIIRHVQGSQWTYEGVKLVRFVVGELFFFFF